MINIIRLFCEAIGALETIMRAIDDEDLKEELDGINDHLAEILISGRLQKYLWEDPKE